MARKRASPNSKEPPQSAARAPSPPSPKIKATPKHKDNAIAEENKPDAKQMEVHHHPEVEKKGIKEYLLEGLMIFLAVFMGFIAENIREDYTEHKKAEAFATTMVTDLTEDTAQLKTYIAYYTVARTNVDTLMRLLATDDVKNISTGKLYLYGLWGGAQRFFIPNDATYEQMKSTGSLQFFEKTVARQAAEYNQQCRAMQIRDESDEAIYTEVRKLRAQIFEFQYNTISNNVWDKAAPGSVRSLRPINIAALDSFIKTKPPLLTYDRSVLNQYVELVRSRYIFRKVSIADTVLAHATTLLRAIKKEYHTEE